MIDPLDLGGRMPNAPFSLAQRAVSATLILLAGGAASSCTSYVKTEVKTEGTPSANESLTGLSYYLPLRRAKITFERKVAADQLDALTKANTAEAAAKKAHAEAKAEAERLTKELEKLKAEEVPIQSEGFIALASKKVAAEVLAEASKKKLDETSKSVTDAKSAYDAVLTSSGTCPILDTISIQLESYVADPRARYSVRLKHSALRTESLNLKTSKSGLLSTVSGEATDQSSEAVLALARSIGGLTASTKSPSSFNPGKSEDGKTCKELAKPLKLESVVIPTRQKDLNSFAEIVNKQAYDPMASYFGNRKLALSIDFLGAPQTDGVAPVCSGNLGGIVYRRELPVLITAKRRSPAFSSGWI